MKGKTCCMLFFYFCVLAYAEAKAVDVQSGKNCITEKQLSDLREVENHGYTVVGNTCKAFIYPSEVHIPSHQLGAAHDNCSSHFPHTHYNQEVQQCICNYGYYKDELTDFCEQCVSCCDEFKYVIQACVNQGEKDKICKAVHPCYPVTDKSSWLDRHKTAVIMYSCIGVGSLVIIGLVIFSAVKIKAYTKERRAQNSGENKRSNVTEDTAKLITSAS